MAWFASRPWARKLLRLVVPTTTSFLCFSFVVIRPLSDLGGVYAFLPYTSMILFFFPLGGVTAQTERTVVNILAGTLGLAWSSATLAIAGACGRKYGADTDGPRAVTGLGLGLLALICGFARSCSPRLNIASRIALFYPIFVLTANQGITSWDSSLFLDLFLIMLFAAAFAVIPTMIPSGRSIGPRLGETTVDILDTINQLMPFSLSSVLDQSMYDTGDEPRSSNKGKGDSRSIEQRKLAARLRTMHTQLVSLVRLYRLEIDHTSLSPHNLDSVVTTIGKMLSNPLLGPISYVPGERTRAALERYQKTNDHTRSHSPAMTRPASMSYLGITNFHDPTLDLENMILLATNRIVSPRPLRHTVSRRVVESLDSRTHSPGTPPGETELLDACKEAVEVISNELRCAARDLALAYGWARAAQPGDEALSSGQGGKAQLETTTVRLQLALTAVLDIARVDQKTKSVVVTEDPERDGNADIGDQNRGSLDASLRPSRHAGWSPGGEDHFRTAFHLVSLLDLAKDVHQLLLVVENIVARSRRPKRWIFPVLSWLPIKVAKQSAEVFTARVDAAIGHFRHPSAEDDERDYDSYALDDQDYVTAAMYRFRPYNPPPKNLAKRAEQAWIVWWNAHRVLRFRIRLSDFLRSLHSRHVPFSLKMAIGISLLSIPALLPPQSRGRAWYANSRGAWTVFSYMYVLEPHTGAIFKVGYLRLIGTFTGALAAYICTLIAHDNPYALVVLATTCSVGISYLILFTRYPPIGIVCGITFPPVLFLSYLNLDEGQTSFTIAWHRFVDITIGIVAAVIVGTMVWPNHARIRYFTAMSSILDGLEEYYLNMSRDNLRVSLVYQTDDKRYAVLEADIRRHLLVSRNMVVIQRNEVSLLPRPIKLCSEIIDATEQLLEILTEIRTLRFSVPRKATVLDVLPIRRELISAVLMTMWTCGQAFRTRSPIPQYLPSSRKALAELMVATGEHARRVRSHRDDGGVVTAADQNMELSIVYGMAEDEALGELCNTLDEWEKLVAVARTLFGTQTFFPRDSEA